MVLRCSLLGHDYGETEVEREREERGSEVVITVREYQVCRRCGKQTVISENTEVRGRTDESHDEPAPDQPPKGTDQSVEATGESPSAPEDSVVIQDAESAEPLSPASDSETVTDDGEILEDEPPSTDRGHGEWPDSSDVGPPVGAANEPAAWPDDGGAADAAVSDEPVTDGSELIDDQAPDTGNLADDPVTESGHATDDPATDTSNVTDDSVTDSGHATDDPATDTSKATDDPVTDSGHVIDDSVTDTSKATDDPVPDTTVSEKSQADSSDEITDDGIVLEHTEPAAGQGGDLLATDDERTTDGPSSIEGTEAAVGNPESHRIDGPTEFYCPRCSFTTNDGVGSLRPGDICPNCRRGYLGERPRE